MVGNFRLITGKLANTRPKINQPCSNPRAHTGKHSQASEAAKIILQALASNQSMKQTQQGNRAPTRRRPKKTTSHHKQKHQAQRTQAPYAILIGSTECTYAHTESWRQKLKWRQQLIGEKHKNSAAPDRGCLWRPRSGTRESNIVGKFRSNANIQFSHIPATEKEGCEHAHMPYVRIPQSHGHARAYVRIPQSYGHACTAKHGETQAPSMALDGGCLWQPWSGAQGTSTHSTESQSHEQAHNMEHMSKHAQAHGAAQQEAQANISKHTQQAYVGDHTQLADTLEKHTKPAQ